MWWKDMKMRICIIIGIIILLLIIILPIGKPSFTSDKISNANLHQKSPYENLPLKYQFMNSGSLTISQVNQHCFAGEVFRSMRVRG